MHNRLWAFLLCAFWLFSLAAYGADPTGTIAGTVLDPSGSAVADAKITATALPQGLRGQPQAPAMADTSSLCYQ